MNWTRISKSMWRGLRCGECQSALTNPWFYRRAHGKHLRRCAACYGALRQKTFTDTREVQQTLFRDQPSAITRLGPPYAARHPLPADYTPTGSQIAPWEPAGNSATN